MQYASLKGVLNKLLGVDKPSLGQQEGTAYLEMIFIYYY